MDIFDIFYKSVYPFELQIIFKLMLAFVVGGIMGYTRTISGKPAGIRTQILLCVGSTLLAAISIHLKDIYVSPNADPARLMAQIVTGIGFVGGGVILKSDRKILGVTTAAMIWVTAAIGIAIGSGFYLVSLAMLVIVLSLEPIAKLQYKYGLKSKPYILVVPTKNINGVLNLLEKLDIRERGQDAENSHTNVHILSSYQKNDKLELALAKRRIKFKLKKITTQDFE